MRYLITGGSGWIGRSLIDELRRNAADADILNLDIRPTIRPDHEMFWHRGDILDAAHVSEVFAEFQPTHVVHLAAQTMLPESYGLEAYKADIDGTRNVIDGAAQTSSVECLLVTSTAYVIRPGYKAKNDEDYCPHSVYGQSKVFTEKVTREANLDRCWAIVRPGTVWGPGQRSQHTSFLKLLEQNRYYHPGRRPALRPMGYIANVAYEIRMLSQAPAEKVNRRTFYLCDPMTNLYDWANRCSQELLGRDVPVLPRSLVWSGAKAGDLLRGLGKNVPLTTFRYRNMTRNYRVPVERTLEVVGPLPYTLEAAVEEFISWFKSDFDSLPPMPTPEEKAAGV